MTQGCQSSRGRTARGFTQENSSPIRTALVQMARSDRLRWRLEADLRTASRRAWAMPARSPLLRTTCWRAGSGSATSSYRCALRSLRDRRQQGPDCQNLIKPLSSNCIQEGPANLNDLPGRPSGRRANAMKTLAFFLSDLGSKRRTRAARASAQFSNARIAPQRERPRKSRFPMWCRSLSGSQGRSGVGALAQPVGRADCGGFESSTGRRTHSDPFPGARQAQAKRRARRL